jgi:hypothetical protein
MVSEARIRVDSGKSARSFKAIICVDISEIESYMPSHAVRSLWGSCPGCRIVCQRGTLSEDCGDCNATRPPRVHRRVQYV